MRCSAQGLVLVVQQEVQETQVEVREIQQEVQVTQMEVQEIQREVQVEVVATRQVPCMQFQAKVTGYLMSNIQIQYTAVLSLTAVHNL